jgi:1-pyrroline-5-carboxylate dehydrogenase
MSSKAPHKVSNLLQGQWVAAGAYESIPDPLTGAPFLSVPLTSDAEAAAFGASLASCGKTGLHNPFHKVERYLMLGRVCRAAAAALRTPETLDYFTRLIQRTSPKSYAEARGEVSVCAAFLENFTGDNVRFLARGFSVPGNHVGQRSNGHRFPFGPVSIITPFNFPLEIPVLQAMGALFMGNKPLVKVDSKVSVAFEEFLRMLHACGLPKEDVDLVRRRAGRRAGLRRQRSRLSLNPHTHTAHLTALSSLHPLTLDRCTAMAPLLGAC